jgi:hypothetical protein
MVISREIRNELLRFLKGAVAATVFAVRAIASAATFTDGDFTVPTPSVLSTNVSATA